MLQFFVRIGIIDFEKIDLGDWILDASLMVGHSRGGANVLRIDPVARFQSWTVVRKADAADPNRPRLGWLGPTRARQNDNHAAVGALSHLCIAQRITEVGR